MKKSIGNAVLLFTIVFLLTMPVLAEPDGEAPDSISEASPMEEQGSEAPAPDQNPASELPAEPPPGLSVDPTPKPDAESGSPMKLLADYWWILLIAAGGIGVAIMVAKGRRTAAPVQTGRPAPAAYPPTVRIGNAHHIGARESQQDSFGISDVSIYDSKGVFAVVADGMGGMADGGEISAIVTRTMLQYFTEVGISGKPELDMLNMLHASNDNVNRFLSGRGKGGSTVVAVLILGGELYWIAVGDSRICLIRNGAVIQINREHVYAVDLDEKAATGEISWEAAANDPQRAALTNYLGMGKLEKTDRNIRPMRLLPGDRLLLMSDGVFGTLPDSEILETMSWEAPQSGVALQEKVLAKQRPNQDNLTAVILEYK